MSVIFACFFFAAGRLMLLISRSEFAVTGFLFTSISKMNCH